MKFTKKLKPVPLLQAVELLPGSTFLTSMSEVDADQIASKLFEKMTDHLTMLQKSEAAENGEIGPQASVKAPYGPSYYGVEWAFDILHANGMVLQVLDYTQSAGMGMAEVHAKFFLVGVKGEAGNPMAQLQQMMKKKESLKS